MSLTTIEAMTQAVALAGGRMTEEQYLEAVCDLITASGRETTVKSLKSNAFSASRMDKAGVCRVSIGDDRQVWSKAQADILLAGGAPMVNSVVSASTTPTPVGVVPADDTPVATVQVGGSFYGVPRNSPEAVADLSDYLKSLIPARRVFVESDRQEYRLLANRLRRSLAGDTIKAHMLCVGPTGCGKSELAKSFFHEVQRPLLRVNLSDGITEDQFIGSRTLRDGEVVFQDGLLTMAAELGLPLLCDEINAARENILIALNGLMDTGMLVIPDDNNRVVKAKAGFMIIGTMNPPEDYAGVNEMNAATKNRFTYSIPFTYLPRDMEVKVVMQQTGFADEDLVGNLVDLANDLRRLKKEHQMESDTSTRMLVQLVDEMQDLSLSEAVRYVMIGRYLPDEMATVEAAARARLEDFA
jgi:MoxR-like ATPase